MLSNLSNNNAGNQTKSVVERKHYEAIEDRLNELQDEIDSNTESINQNAQDISGLDERMGVVEENSTFPELSTDTINPATGDEVRVTSDLKVDGKVESDSIETGSLSVNGTNFEEVKQNASQAKTTAENAKNKADEAYNLADALSDELADYKSDNEQSITTGTLNADSVVTDSVAAQTINTNDFETTNAVVDKLYVDTIKATGFLELPTTGQSYYTITIPAKTTASFSGVYTSDNNTDYPYYFTVSDGAVIYKQGSTEIIKDISFDRETGNTKVRVKSSTNITYISSALDNNPVTIEDGGDAYADYAFIPQKTGGYLIRGYDDTTTEIYIAGVLKAYAMSIEEEIIERTSVDFLKVNASIELPKDWDAGGTISYSTGEENQYISAQTKAGVTKPTWTSPIHSTIGSLSYSSKLVDEATVASYKGISETRQTQTISIANEASLQQLTAFHWTKNGTYWQPYELTRITIGDQTMWIDPTESNQGIRFIDNQVIADGTWNDVPVEEANAVPVNLVIFDAPTELSFPITNLGDKTTVHGEITATCFKGNVLGNVTGNADTATNATCFDSKTYAEAKEDILSGCAADSNKFNGKTYSEACADILSGNAATATNATCFDGHTYECAKADILSGCASAADNATCFDGHTYADAKADILSGNAASATNATCFNGKTYAQAKSDILSGTAAQAHCVDIDSLTTNSYPLVMESTTCELGKSGTCPITFTPSTGILETNQVSTSCIENSGTTKSQYLCATCDINVDGNAYITGDLTVQGTITTTHSEEVVTPSENIILRDGATTPIASGCYSGFTVTNYDGQDNNLEVGADKDGTLHVGVVGGTMEPIATRATEACMENGYAAHWDSTGTDLVTKGATNTHDLTVNGDASVTGTLTADLTGTADNATCFDGKTYAEAKVDILSGCASNADNSTCFDNKTYAEACADILSGCASNADNATCFGGCTYSEAKTDILSGCAADSAKLGNKLPSCYIDNSSTAQTKAGNLSIGAPAACTSTSSGGNGLFMNSLGTISLYKEGTPYIDFHYDKYCGGYSSRICNSYVSQECRGSLDITVNNGTGCTVCTECANYCFKSDGTFTGAGIICASANIYSAGCPVVTTGTLPTVAPGYNCTGTSNYVVTTMVCCAKQICRNQATTGTCHLALFSDKTAVANADMYVSNACELTYAPATGDLKAGGSICASNGFTSDGGPTIYVHHSNELNMTSTSTSEPSSVWLNYRCGIDTIKVGKGDGTSNLGTVCADIFWGRLWHQCTDSYGTNINTSFVTSQATIGGNGSTFVTLGQFRNGYSLSSCAYLHVYGDMPGSQSACFVFDSDGTICAPYARVTNRISVGSPSACTSTSVGCSGTFLELGSFELYHTTPYIDFHANNACVDFSHRIIANDGYLRVTATDATGCTPPTQSADFDFCSDGTLKATCFDGIINMNCVADAAFIPASANTASRKTIIRNSIANVGYTTSVAIGLCRGTTGWSQAMISVSCNDAGTAWYDYCFDTYGRITGTNLCFDGNATTATTAGSATVSDYTKVEQFTTNTAYNVALATTSQTCGCVGVSDNASCCALTFNPATGDLKASGAVCATSLVVNSLSIYADSRGPIHLQNGNSVLHLGNDYDVSIGYDAGAQSYGIALGNAAIAANRGIAAGTHACAACDAIALGVAACAKVDSSIAIGDHACAEAGPYLGKLIDCHVVYSTGASAHFRFGGSVPQCEIYCTLACLGEERSPMWPIGCGCTYCGRHMIPAKWIFRSGDCSDAGRWLSWDGDGNIDLTGADLGSDHAICGTSTASFGARIEIWADWPLTYWQIQ